MKYQKFGHDQLSKGRLFMGIGASYFEEAKAYGIPFYSSSQERLQRLEEIIRKMWTEEPSASFVGKYYQIRTHTAIQNQYRNLHRLYDDSEDVARKRAQQFYIGIPEQQIRDKNLQYMEQQKMYQDK